MAWEKIYKTENYFRGEEEKETKFRPFRRNSSEVYDPGLNPGRICRFLISRWRPEFRVERLL